jgi:hypothetical protein
MLEGLCGNQNIQKILLFLLVNGKCYGTQLHRLLKVPLTPIQKALLRLEKGGIVVSEYEGKTRLYQFNPAFPLLSELEPLLKKAYSLLPAHEKKRYYVTKEGQILNGDPSYSPLNILMKFWGKLATIKQLTFSAKTKSQEKSGWNGNGKGEVVMTKEEENVYIFNEKGSWQGKQGEFSFSNIFRWTLDRQTAVISLEHLRRGWEHPIFLFHLTPSGHSSLASVDSHLCEGDTYFGQLFFDRYGLRLTWRVVGPKKNEIMDYYYS